MQFKGGGRIGKKDPVEIAEDTKDFRKVRKSLIRILGPVVKTQHPCT